MSTEKTSKCISVTPTVGKTGKTYLKVVFADGSSYNWQTFKPPFTVGMEYKLLIEPNGNFQNIVRADPVGVSSPATAPAAPTPDDSALMDALVANNTLLGEILNAINTLIQIQQVPK